MKQFTIRRQTMPAVLSPAVIMLLVLMLSGIMFGQYRIRNSATGSSYQSTISKNTNYQIQAVIGQTFSQNRSDATTNSVSAGMYSFYIMQPSAPIVEASQGDFADRVNITWKWDVLSPANNTGNVEIFRDGVLLATVPRTQNFYQDFNVYPGKYYYYEVAGRNEFGWSYRGGSAGFINPNGTITGAITTQFGRPVYDVEVGVSPTLGKALRFNSDARYVDAGYNLDLGNKSFTIEYWLKRPQNPSPNVSLFIQNPLGAAGTPQLTIGYAGPTQLVFGFSSTDFLAVTDTSALDQWHHYAFVYDDQLRKRSVYINGKLAGSGATAQNQQYTSAGGQVWLGKGVGSNNFIFDEMRVWTTARSNDLIVRNMKRTVNTNSENLAAYWKFDEGVGLMVFDLSPNTNNGILINSFNGVYSDDRSPIRTSAFSDLNGNFVIEGINYGSSTNFSVTPVREGRIFSPPTRIVTLSSSNTAANNIDYTDISQVPVSGFVRHLNGCYADSVEILVNGESTVPATFTNAEGKYILEFEPGSSNRVSPRRTGFTFAPAFREYQNVVDPIAGEVFQQTTNYSFRGKVGGGNCDLPIGPVQIILEGIGNNHICFTDTLVTDMTGSFAFYGLSPVRYRVFIDPENPNWTAKSDTIDLRNGSVEKNYRYYADITVEVTGLPPVNDCFGVPLLDQFVDYALTYKVFEEYTYNGQVTGRCPVDTAIVTIKDGFGDRQNSPYELRVVGGSIIDTIVTGYPNVLGDFKKTFEIVAEHRDGRSTDTVYQGIITGYKPQTGSFVTVSPALPLMILRDPPGDGSYSFVSQETTTKYNWSLFAQDRATKSYSHVLSLAPDFETEVGFIFGSTKVEQDNTLDFTTDVSYTYTSTNSTELETELTVSEVFRTDEDQGIVGEEGDVIMGAALNFTYALTDLLTFRQDSCLLQKSQTLTFAPTGFNTTYIYTTNYIENVLIPRLMGVDTLVKEANHWKKILAYNDTLKAQAEFERNISFSAGSTAEYQQTTVNTETKIFEFDLTIDYSFGGSVGVTFNGAGTVSGFEIKTGMSYGGSRITTTTSANTVGYSLRDDDPGDALTVDIFKDPVFGTPVFETVAGTTSCPWEEGTQARDIPRLQAGSTGTTAVNVDPNEPAVFLINIGNENSAETREYYMRVLNESNPNGAVVAVNGIIIEQGINFNIGPGQSVQAVLTITRGPQAYVYEDISVILTSPCEFDRYQGVGNLAIYEQLDFDVYFKEPCTQVAIDQPAPNWLINSSSGNGLNVRLFGYDKNDPDLQRIEVQYRRMSASNSPLENKTPVFESNDERNAYISSVLATLRMPSGDIMDYDQVSYDHILDLISDKGIAPSAPVGDDPTPWFTFATILKDSLGPEYHNLRWELMGEADGSYEIRAVAVCGLGNTDGVSAAISGIIDRTRPEILGLPEPVDAVLNADDQIKVTFTEDISCATIDPLDNIELIYTQTGTPVLFDFSCNGSELLITPQGSYAPFENKTLKAVVKRIKDKNGNIMRVTLGTTYIDSLGWEFLVDRNPVRWTGGEIDVVKYLDETVDMQRTLQNTGSFNQPFTITDLPLWLMPTIISGTVQIQSSTTIGFRFGQDIPAGIYEDTVYAQTMNGNEPLIVRLRVLCRPPVWSLNTAAYQYNMNMIAELYVDTTRSSDRYDRIAAFAGNELRGMAELQYIQAINRHLAFITVYSNVTSNEELTFRVWDASECTEYGQIMENFSFKADTVIGSYQVPVKMTATRQIIEDYSFNAGWTWFSLNTRSGDMSVNSVLSSLNPAKNDMIKDQNGFSQYTQNAGWIGQLTALNNKTMYMIRLAQRDTLRRTGYAIDPLTDTLRLAQGWSWIGYTPNADMQINQALASLQASDGDIIKSQTAFSVYAQGIGWIGSLQFMRPRQGYLIKMANAGTLIYPRVSGQQNNISEPDILPGVIPSQPLWTLDRAQYQHTMNIIAKVGGDYADSLRTGDMIALFAGEECRGLAYPVVIPGKKEMYIFLTGYANQASGEFLNMMLWRESSDQVIDLGTGVQFTADGVIGTIEQPMILTPVLSSADDMSGIPAEYSLDQNYPNPFNPTTLIRFGLPEEAEISLTIYNIMGEAVRLLDAGRKNAGYHQAVWDGRNNHGEYVPSGIYLYTLKAGERSFTKKIVFLK